jgi:hypothetical protein
MGEPINSLNSINYSNKGPFFISNFALSYKAKGEQPSKEGFFRAFSLELKPKRPFFKRHPLLSAELARITGPVQ